MLNCMKPSPQENVHLKTMGNPAGRPCAQEQVAAQAMPARETGAAVTSAAGCSSWQPSCCDVAARGPCSCRAADGQRRSCPGGCPAAAAAGRALQCPSLRRASLPSFRHAAWLARPECPPGELILLPQLHSVFLPCCWHLKGMLAMILGHPFVVVNMLGMKGVN